MCKISTSVNHFMQIQGHSPTVSVTQEDAGDMSDSRFDESSIIELPLCELGKLEEIFDLVSTTIPSPMHRESLVHAMERDNYIPKLLELFHICEDLENITGLHHLYNIFRTLFLINKASLLNIIFQEEHIVSVVGCLEYNPNKPHPVCHRDYLAQVAKHREVIPFNNPQLLNKVRSVILLELIPIIQSMYYVQKCAYYPFAFTLPPEVSARIIISILCLWYLSFDWYGTEP